MIGYFPTPYPDELFYSLCARYSDRMGYSTKIAVRRDLFNTEKLLGSILLAQRIRQFIGNLPAGYVYSVERVIDRHTLLPFFAPFLPQDRVKRLRADMAEGNGYVTPLEAGIRSRKIHLPEHLMYCPQCVIEDRTHFGDAYWHRLHQIPGVEVCPEHQCWLEMSRVAVSNSGNWGAYTSAERDGPDLPPRVLDSSNVSHQVLLAIARDFQWLGAQTGLVIDTEALRQRYLTALAWRGLASLRRSISEPLLEQAISSQYSPELLQLLQCTLNDKSRRSNWMNQLLYKTKGYHPPVYHLLFINFLGFTLPEFLDYPTRFLPFGKSPWPCLNPVCSNYLRNSIPEAALRHTEGVLGIFTCPACGFSYTRRGPDTSSQDRFRRNAQVREYGPVWEDKLIELWMNPAISVKEMAKQLGVGVDTLKTQAKRLGLRNSRLGHRYRVSEWESRDEADKKAFREKRNSYRNKWLLAIEQDSHLKTSELMNKHSAVYAWLNRNDTRWLNVHLPPKKPRNPPSSPPVDWSKLDPEIAKSVREAAIFLKKQFPSGKRVTIHAIGKLLGKSHIFLTQLNELPLTRQALAETTETQAEFDARRIWRAAESYCREGRLPSFSDFVAKAGVSFRIKTPGVRQMVEQALALVEWGDCESIKTHNPGHSLSEVDVDSLKIFPAPARDLRLELINKLQTADMSPPQRVMPPNLEQAFERTSMVIRSRQFSKAYKLRILAELDACATKEERVVIRRREDILLSLVNAWRHARDAGKLK